MAIVTSALYVLSIFCAAPIFNEAAKKACPNQGPLATIIAEQNNILVDVIKEIQKLKIELTDMKQDTQADIKDLEEDVRFVTAAVESTKAQVESVKAELEYTKSELDDIKEELEMLAEHLKTIVVDISKTYGGSTYVRWGKKTCPAGENNTMVYSGMVGGKYYTHKGSGTNALCLTTKPDYDGTPKPSTTGFIYGAEYEGTALQDQDIPCSVCHTHYITTVMVPGTIRCPIGWTVQYEGHLASAYYAHFATEFVCLDVNAEGMSAVKTNSNGFLLYFVLSKCGALHCPPYENDRVVTCVVCSK